MPVRGIPYSATSYENPAPVGSEVDIGDLSVIVVEFIRSANAVIESGNMFNPPPDPGHEYVLVGISASCNAEQGETCRLSQFDFNLIGSQGIFYDTLMFVQFPGRFRNAEIYSGGKVSGLLGFEIDCQEVAPKLVYNPMFSETRVYFSVP